MTHFDSYLTLCNKINRGVEGWLLIFLKEVLSFIKSYFLEVGEDLFLFTERKFMQVRKVVSQKQDSFVVIFSYGLKSILVIIVWYKHKDCVLTVLILFNPNRKTCISHFRTQT